MAKIEIAGASVVRLIADKGFVAKTSYDLRSGQTIEEYWTVWTSEPVEVGDTLGITGLLRVKLDEWDDRKTGEKRQAAAAHVNQPKIVNYGQAGSGTLDSPTVPTFSEEAPF